MVRRIVAKVPKKDRIVPDRIVVYTEEAVVQ